MSEDLSAMEEFVREDLARIMKNGFKKWEEFNWRHILHTDYYAKENIVYLTSDFQNAV